MIILCTPTVKKETDLAVGGGQRAGTRASFCIPHNSGIYTVRKYRKIFEEIRCKVIYEDQLPLGCLPNFLLYKEIYSNF